MTEVLQCTQSQLDTIVSNYIATLAVFVGTHRASSLSLSHFKKNRADKTTKLDLLYFLIFFKKIFCKVILSATLNNP